MKRRHLFEFEDQKWFPSLIRNYMTDYLRFASEKFRLFEPVVPVLTDLLNRTGQRQVVDLGSGGGGAWRTMGPRLREAVEGLTITLTDLYPNASALTELVAGAPDLLRFMEQPVDATNVPSELTGLRTQFLSLHHFGPEIAGKVLRNAVDARQPIAIFEAQRRDAWHLVKIACSSFLVLPLTPFIRPFKFGRLLFTYLPPVVPFFVLWDGWVSVLRTHNADEMLALAKSVDETDEFEWESGELRGVFTNVPYLTGRPLDGPRSARVT